MTRPHDGTPDHGVRRLFASASLNVMASAGSAVAGLAATGLMARHLPVDDFGKVMLMVTATNAFAIFEGLRPVVIVRIAQRDGEPSALFRATARINALMACITMACLAASALVLAPGSLPLLAWSALALTVLCFFAVMQYWSYLDAESDTIFTGLARGTGWLLLYLAFSALAILRADIDAFAMALLAMNVGLLVVFRVRFMRLALDNRYGNPGTALPMRALLRPAMDNILFNVSAVTINLVDRAAVGLAMGAARAGLYAGPSELMLRAGGLMRAAMQVVLPWAARQSTDGGHRQRLWLAATAGVAMLAGGAAVAVLAFRDPLTVYLLGERFRPAADLLGIFGIAVLTSAIGYTSIAYLNARGDFATQRSHYAWSAVALVLAAGLAASAGELLWVALTFLAARCVDLLLAMRVLRECTVQDRQRVAAGAAALLLALVGGWFAAIVPALLGLIGLAVAAAALMRRPGGSTT